MFVYYINIPMNDIGISELEGYDEEMTNVKTFTLTQEEYDSLRRSGGLFQKFDERFGTLIDVCEEERINCDDLEEALEIAHRCLNNKKKNESEIKGIDTVIKSLECAIQALTFWEIDAFLET